MASEKPTPEDVSKLHAEANQYINQRFTVAMTAIAVFGVVFGLVVTSVLSVSGGKPVVRPVTYLLATLLLIVLLVLLVVSQIILGSLGVVAAYLRVTGASVWERDYLKFAAARQWSVSQHDMHLVLFGFLGGLAVVSPFFLSSLFEPEEGTRLRILIGLHVGASAAYAALLALLARNKLFRFGADADEVWTRALRGEAGEGPRPPTPPSSG